MPDITTARRPGHNPLATNHGPFSLLASGSTMFVNRFDPKRMFYDETIVVNDEFDFVRQVTEMCERRRAVLKWLTIQDHGRPGAQEFGNGVLIADQLRPGQPQYKAFKSLAPRFAPRAVALFGGCFTAAANDMSLIVALSKLWPNVYVTAFDQEQVAFTPGWHGNQFTALNGKVTKGRFHTVGVAGGWPGKPTIPPAE